MTDPESVKLIAQFGIGAALAAFMFLFYRRDVKGQLEAAKSDRAELMKLVQENVTAMVRLDATVANNTMAMGSAAQSIANNTSAINELRHAVSKSH